MSDDVNIDDAFKGIEDFIKNHEPLPFDEAKNMELSNPNSMRVWFPILEEIKEKIHDDILKIPKTLTVQFTNQKQWSHMLEPTAETKKEFKIWLDIVKKQIKEQGFEYPLFIRNSATSMKHSWKDTCYVKREKDLGKQISHLFYESLCAGAPNSYFLFVRELIETDPKIVAFNGDMPIAKEFRFFINEGLVLCYHPYWPEEAFENTNISEDIYKPVIEEFNEIDDNLLQKITTILEEYIGLIFIGYWSVDFLIDVNGDPWLIDMALGENSYHYPGCKHINNEE